MDKNNKDYPLQIHFKGVHLDKKSIPIYELGETLLAIQRMVIQGYLIAVERDKQKGKETHKFNGIQHKVNQKKIREDLSLRLVGQTKGSDAYLLEWFNNMATIVAPHLLGAALGIVFEAGLKYMGQGVNRSLSSLPARMMFNEFLVLSNRIKRVGDIDSIEIMVKGKPHPIVIDGNTKAYIYRNKQIPVLAEKPTSIEGRVVTAHIMSHEIVDISPVKPNWLKHRVRVDMTGAEFDDVLQHSVGRRNTLFNFKGNPRLRPGDDERNFREFKANYVSPVKNLKIKKPAGKIKAKTPGKMKPLKKKSASRRVTAMRKSKTTRSK